VSVGTTTPTHIIRGAIDQLQRRDKKGCPMSKLPAIEKRRFDPPDEKLDFKERGRINIIKMHDGTAGMHAIFEPGWTWAVDEKPLLGHPDSCPLRHVGYSIGGDLVVRMVESGVETHIRSGDFFDIPPGHDAYVDGAERAELILFAAPEPDQHPPAG
jgi:hypothetical protein